MSDLIPLYQEMAAGGANFHGLTLVQYAEEIGKLIRKHDAKHVLDYGCGRGDAYKMPHRVHRVWGLKWWDVTLYDPAFPRLDEKPHGKRDGVICCDVLEHIPEEDVDVFVATLFSHANKFIWASFCNRPAKKTFPDGTNLHVTQRPFEWWDDKFLQHATPGVVWQLKESV